LLVLVLLCSLFYNSFAFAWGEEKENLMVERDSWQRGPERTILIVDDERSLADAIAETLDLEQLHTVVTYDGGQALNLAQKLQPDLVLLDVSMPGMSGIEVCKTLKADPQTAAIPVIFVTARVQQNDRKVGLAAGADAYLTKPFSPIQLIELVDRVLMGQPILSQARQPDLSAMPGDQLVVYARELKNLFEQEQSKRRILQTAQERLDELDRLKAAFLGAVTHELLTPFANIGLALQVLQRQSEALHLDQQETLEDLSTEISHLHRLVSGVVKFAVLVNKQREPQPGYLALDHIIPWAVQPVAELSQVREIDFRVFVPPDLPRVHADPELLGEAIFQMAHNAVKFNLPGGEARLRAFESNRKVIIEVTDTGVGLTPERLVLLGQPFEQTADALRRGQEGLGIGWAFVCYVAQVHAGWTRVESPGAGQGSTFVLALPVTVND
jgi:signal transduction histidine kinase